MGQPPLPEWIGKKFHIRGNVTFRTWVRIGRMVNCPEGIIDAGVYMMSQFEMDWYRQETEEVKHNRYLYQRE